MALQSGDTLGQYTIREQIGNGGMATVYRADHARLDRPVAIKVMHQNFTSDPQFHARFEREARIVARLEHPHIVPVYDFDEIEQQPYLVMKYVDGPTLKDRLRQSPLTTQEIVALLSQIADALDYAHEQGVLHRDIKPSNILLDARDGRPYLTDFGLARLAAAGESTMSADVMLGTPHYISPEQAKGQTDLDTRTDVYSLGVVLYELVVGRVPYTADTPYAIVHDHIYAPPPDPRTQNPNVSDAVAQVLEKALAKQPADRYASPGALVADFQRALAGERIAPPATQEPPTVQPTHDGESRIKVKRREGDEWEALGESIGAVGERLGERAGEWGERIGEWGERFGERMEEWGRKIEERIENATVEAKYRAEGYSSEEARIRARVEKRIEKRREDLGGLIAHLVTFIIIAGFIMGFNSYVNGIFTEGDFMPNGVGQWIALLWFFGLISNFFDYYNKYGFTGDRQERVIQREIDRERRRMERLNEAPGKAKRKNEATPNLTTDPRAYDDTPPVRLTEDGEFTDSFIDELNEAPWRDDSQRR